jgi:hypothetical protein
MTAFADHTLLGFMDTVFIEDLLSNRLGLPVLLNLVYQAEDVDFQQLELAGIRQRQFAVPAFETFRTRGTDERIVPTTERVKVDREQPRRGRLAWVDVLLDVEVTAKVADKAMPLEAITARTLLDKVGGATSIAELKTKLAVLYPPSIVDAFFARFPFDTADDFVSNPTLFLEFAFKAPVPFDPADPKTTRSYRLDVCVQLQSELKIAEALQAAKLCRGILENEHDHAEAFEGGQIRSPYAFVVIFPDAAAVDDALPGMSGAEIKAATKGLFQAEGMLAHFA